MRGVFRTVFIILGGMVLVWFVLVKILFVRLERKHPDKYKDMGEPSLIWNNSMKTNWAFMKFLFRREHKTFDDPSISRLSDFMLVFFALYTALFFGLILRVFTVGF